MNTQNVSAQLYFKQLPEDPTAGPVQSDAQLENTFQQQLNLSEYYKSPQVFNTMKENYMDKTVEGIYKQPMVTSSVYPSPPPVQPNTMVGPTDFLNKFIKEGFGSTTMDMGMVVLIIIVIAIIAHFSGLI